MHSAIYSGVIRHRRFEPRAHQFSYRVFMMYLDLAEIDGIFSDSWLWSARRPALAWYRRADFFGDPEVPLNTAVQDLVEQRTGERPAGPIRMLANLRYFGYLINPISCYYCFDPAGEDVQFIVAEVTNTPWNERCAYVIRTDPKLALQRNLFTKLMHVSPFNPMDMKYHWTSRTPGERLSLHLETHSDSQRIVDATLCLKREPITPRQLRRTLLEYPLMTAKVAWAIHYQALKLWLKGIPFYPHPSKNPNLETKTV